MTSHILRFISFAIKLLFPLSLDSNTPSKKVVQFMNNSSKASHTSNTACASDIDSYVTPLGQAR